MTKQRSGAFYAVPDNFQQITPMVEAIVKSLSGFSGPNQARIDMEKMMACVSFIAYQMAPSPPENRQRLLNMLPLVLKKLVDADVAALDSAGMTVVHPGDPGKIN